MLGCVGLCFWCFVLFCIVLYRVIISCVANKLYSVLCCIVLFWSFPLYSTAQCCAVMCLFLSWMLCKVVLYFVCVLCVRLCWVVYVVLCWGVFCSVVFVILCCLTWVDEYSTSMDTTQYNTTQPNAKGLHAGKLYKVRELILIT